MTTQQKPRIRKCPRFRTKAPLWVCFMLNGDRTGFVGLGFTPEQAYEDWRKAQ